MLRSALVRSEDRGTIRLGNFPGSAYVVVATLLVVLGPPAALSQSAQVDQPISSSGAQGEKASAQSEGLEEIVVTATRRAESAEKIPISIAALGQDQITALGITDIADLSTLTPGLQYDVPNGYSSTIETVAIRGMNTQVGANVVGIYLDDTPIQSRLPAYGNFGTPVPLTFDMQRIEVARGPQGTLFGAGSEAGTIRFIPNEPSLNTYTALTQADVAFTQGGDPSYQVGVAAGGPIVDNKLGFRISFWDQEDGGYIDRVNPVSGETVPPFTAFTGQTVARNANTDDRRSARIALGIQVTDNTQITPAVYYQQVHQSDSGRFFGNLGPTIPAGATVNGVAGPSGAAGTNYYGSNPSEGIFNNGTFVGARYRTLMQKSLEDATPRQLPGHPRRGSLLGHGQADPLFVVIANYKHTLIELSNLIEKSPGQLLLDAL